MVHARSTSSTVLFHFGACSPVLLHGPIQATWCSFGLGHDRQCSRHVPIRATRCSLFWGMTTWCSQHEPTWAHLVLFCFCACPLTQALPVFSACANPAHPMLTCFCAHPPNQAAQCSWQVLTQAHLVLFYFGAQPPGVLGKHQPDLPGAVFLWHMPTCPGHWVLLTHANLGLPSVHLLWRVSAHQGCPVLLACTNLAH